MALRRAVRASTAAGSNDGATMNAQPEEPVRSPPLEGVRILDMSRLVVGNMMTHVLADMGADVIKIERLGEGDATRHMLPHRKRERRPSLPTS